MGICLCCFGGSAREEEDEEEEDEEYDDNEEFQENNVLIRTNTSHQADLELVAQDVTIKRDNILGNRTMGPEDEKRSMNHSQVEPKVVDESNDLNRHKSMLCDDDFELSRDDECPICFEGYNSENPRIITKCSHHYHLGCIYSWQERSGLCPICSKIMEFEEMK